MFEDNIISFEDNIFENMNDLSKLVVTLVLLNILVGTGNDANLRFKNKYSSCITLV